MLQVSIEMTSIYPQQKCAGGYKLSVDICPLNVATSFLSCLKANIILNSSVVLIDKTYVVSLLSNT